MMNDSTRVMSRPRRPRRPRRAWPPAARAAAAIIATTVLVLLAACGSGSPSSTGSGGSPNAGKPANSPSTISQKALAFSRCTRARGVPNFPDPTSSGGVPKETAQQLGVSNSRLQAALAACEHLLPNTGNVDDNPAALHRWWSQMLHFALCMHSHGVPNWPDPSPYPPDPVRPTFNLHAAGIGFHRSAQPGNIVDSPQIQAKVRQCDSAMHQDFSGLYE